MAEESSAPNSVTTSPTEPIEIGPGENFSSFDELEAAHSRSTRAHQMDRVSGQKKSEPQPKAKSPVDDEPEHISDEAKEKAEKKAEREDAKQAKAKDAKETDKPDAKAQEKDRTAPGKSQAAKAIKVKNGEEETELPLSAKVSVRVNDQDTEVTLEELRNEYSGKQAWQKKFGELGTEKAKFEREKNIVTSKLGEMFSLSQKDPIAGLMKMAELAGLDPIKYRQDFITALEPALVKRLEMSDDQRRAEDAEAELAYHRNQTQARTDKERDDAAYKAFESEVHSKVQKAGLTNDDFQSTFQTLEQMVKSGEYKTKSGEITPDDVIEAALSYRSFEAAESEMTSLGDLPQDQKQKFLAEFIPMAVAQRLTQAEVRAVVSDTFRDLKASNLSRKVRKSQADAGKTSSAPRNPASEPITFEDL